MVEKIVFMVIAIFSLAFGAFLVFKPLAAFELQRRFYEKINWRIEPISIEKEIRHTKWMGIFLMVFVGLVLMLQQCFPSTLSGVEALIFGLSGK